MSGIRVTAFNPIRQVTQEASETQQHHTNETSRVEEELDNASQRNDRSEIGSEIRRNTPVRT